MRVQYLNPSGVVHILKYPYKNHTKINNNMHIKLSKYLIIFICIMIILIFYDTIVINPSINNYKIINYKHNINVKLKTILLWTKFFDNENWYFEKNTIDEMDLKDFNCPETSCLITRNYTYLNEVYMYDALVFHVAEMWFPYYSTPKKRSPHQIYVFFSLESPATTNHELAYDHNFYNYTMTYRLDSDIIINYGAFKDTHSKLIVNASQNPSWIKPNLNFYDEDLYNRIKRKNKKIAWFVSNCAAPSKRDELAYSLQQYISVDIYGRCGKLRCTENCDTLLDNDYKFYLSFENSLCEDYITEKFFKILKLNVIPIVYGGSDYTKFAPHHSYIDANSFATSAALAEYLIYLDKHPLEYIKYFWWKSHYEIVTSSLMMRRFCDLCVKLHDKKSLEKYQHYRNIKGWWYEDVCKSTPTIVF